MEQQFSTILEIARALDTSADNVSGKVTDLVTELSEERRQVLAMQRELARKEAESLLDKAEIVNGVKLLVARVSYSRMEIMRETSDFIRSRLKSAVVVLGGISGDKPMFLAAVTPDLIDKGYDAGKIVKEVAKVTGGGGGGKATLAQAGGKYKDKLDEALKLVRTLI
ncbi:DHHA1 domain-containing protein [Chloroflexota bacterium]